MNIEPTGGSAAPTEFGKAALVAMGDGTDIIALTFNGNTPDANQEMIVLGTFVVTGKDGEFISNQIVFPFGGHIQFE